VRRLLFSEGLERAEVSVLLTDDSTIRDLNRAYRGIDGATDVLSFSQREELPGAPAVPGATGGPELLGDVVVSVETAERQSRQHGVAPEQELALLAVHGVLHLLGHEDETEQGAARMRACEMEILGLALEAPAGRD
jgi:probable rRNA maturation factor